MYDQHPNGAEWSQFAQNLHKAVTVLHKIAETGLGSSGIGSLLPFIDSTLQIYHSAPRLKVHLLHVMALDEAGRVWLVGATLAEMGTTC
jgi:hypothetical protein